jgi:hypothetical protein
MSGYNTRERKLAARKVSSVTKELRRTQTGY